MCNHFENKSYSFWEYSQSSGLFNPIAAEKNGKNMIIQRPMIEWRIQERGSGWMSRIRGVVANYPASQARDPGINSTNTNRFMTYMMPSEKIHCVSSCNLQDLSFIHHHAGSHLAMRRFRQCSFCRRNFSG